MGINNIIIFLFNIEISMLHWVDLFSEAGGNETMIGVGSRMPGLPVLLAVVAVTRSIQKLAQCYPLINCLANKIVVG